MADGGGDPAVGFSVLRFPFPSLLRHGRRRTRPRASGGCFPGLRESAKQGGFRADFAGEKNNEKSSDTPLLFMNYYGIM